MVRIHSRRRPELSRLDLQQTDLVRPERRAVVVDHPQLRARVGPPDAAALGLPVLLVVGQRPAGHAAAEFGCRIGGQNGYAVLLGEGVGVVGRQRRRAAGDGADAVQVGSRSGRSATPCAMRPAPATPRGAGACAPPRPSVELEAFQQHKGSRLGDALQHPEDAADMHQRRVDDRDAAAQLGGRAARDPARDPSRCAPACRS